MTPHWLGCFIIARSRQCTADGHRSEDAGVAGEVQCRYGKKLPDLTSLVPLYPILLRIIFLWNRIVTERIRKKQRRWSIYGRKRAIPNSAAPQSTLSFPRAAERRPPASWPCPKHGRNLRLAWRREILAEKGSSFPYSEEGFRAYHVGLMVR